MVTHSGTAQIDGFLTELNFVFETARPWHHQNTRVRETEPTKIQHALGNEEYKIQRGSKFKYDIVNIIKNLFKIKDYSSTIQDKLMIITLKKQYNY